MNADYANLKTLVLCVFVVPFLIRGYLRKSAANSVSSSDNPNKEDRQECLSYERFIIVRRHGPDVLKMYGGVDHL
jgi:hypothetical protein